MRKKKLLQKIVAIGLVSVLSVTNPNIALAQMKEKIQQNNLPEDFSGKTEIQGAANADKEDYNMDVSKSDDFTEQNMSAEEIVPIIGAEDNMAGSGGENEGVLTTGSTKDTESLGFTYILDEMTGTAIITGYNGNEIDLTIPETIDGYAVREVGGFGRVYDFENGNIDSTVNQNIQSVKLPNGVTAISEYAFCECSNLKKVEFPDTLERIGAFAFYQSGLEEAKIPEGIKVIEYGAFGYCNLKKIELPDSLEEIREQGIECLKAEELTIPKNVKLWIRGSGDAYFGCKKLTFMGPTTLLYANILEHAEYLETVIAYGNVKCNDGVNTDGDSGIIKSKTAVVYGLSGSFLEAKAKKCGNTFHSLSVPLGIRSKYVGNNILLSWMGNGADGYKIFRSDNPGGEYILIADVSGDSCEYLDENIGSEKQYYYKIQNYYNTSDGEISGLLSDYVVTDVIDEKFDINNADVSIIPSVEYTGQEIKPNVDVQYGSIVLAAGIDYNISYHNNTEVGTASAIIQGINKYTGSKTVYFEIISPARNISEAVVDEISDAKYTGSSITPKVTVKYQGIELKEGQDYTLTYTDNVEIGLATVKISGINGYKGEKIVSFQIIGMIDIANAEINKIKDAEYTGNEIKPEITVKYDGIVLTEEQDYTVTYSNNTKVGTATITIKGINKYKGERIETFEIKKPTISQPKINSLSVVGSKYLKLNWGAVSGAKGYRVYRKNNGSSWKAIKTLSGTTYTDKSVKFGIKYTYTVRAYKIVNGMNYWSTYDKKGKSDTVTYSAPTLSSAKATGYNAVKLTWKKVAGVSGYRVYRKTSANGSYKAIATLGNVSTYTDKKAAGGTTYIYTVRGYKKAGSKYIWGKYNSSGIKVKSKMQPRKIMLKQGTTYTKYDVTGDGKNDKILLKQLFSGGKNQLKIYINGIKALECSFREYFAGGRYLVHLCTTNSKDIFLSVRFESSENDNQLMHGMFKYSGGKLKRILNVQKEFGISGMDHSNINEVGEDYITISGAGAFGSWYKSRVYEVRNGKLRY